MFSSFFFIPPSRHNRRSSVLDSHLVDELQLRSLHSNLHSHDQASVIAHQRACQRPCPRAGHLQICTTGTSTTLPKNCGTSTVFCTVSNKHLTSHRTGTSTTLTNCTCGNSTMQTVCVGRKTTSPGTNTLLHNPASTSSTPLTPMKHSSTPCSNAQQASLRRPETHEKAPQRARQQPCPRTRPHPRRSATADSPQFSATRRAQQRARQQPCPRTGPTPR